LFGFRFGGSLRMTMTTDAELLAGYVREGSDAAFRELVQRHLPMVYGAALRQVGGDAHLAKDVTQTAFVALAGKARKLEGRGTLAGWLYLSAHHAAAQMVRTERRRKIREEAHAMQERLTNGDTTAEWERVRPAIDAALRELGEIDREAVLLRFFEGRPFAAVGASLNVSEDAARMRVERALDKLRGALARHGITSTAAALGAVLTSHASVVAPAALVAEIASAAALGGAGVVVSATIFMKTLMIAVSAVAVVAIGGALYQAQQAQRAATDAALAEKQRDAMVATLKAAQVRAEEAERRMRAVETRAVAEKANAPASSGTPPSPSRVASITAVAADGTSKGTIHYADTPEGRRAMIRHAVGQTFGAFFRKMEWDERQQDLFKELFADRKESERKKFQGAQTEGKRLGNDVAKAIFEEASREFDERLQLQFGTGVVEAKRDYEAKGAFRHVAEETVKRVFYSDAPLTHQQADRLAEIMALNSRRTDGKFDIDAMDRNSVFAQAQGILSPAQLAAFREVDAEQRRQRELEQRAQSERKNVAAPSK